MNEPLAVLMVEDSEDDARLILRELKRSGFEITWDRVQTAAALREQLLARTWDVIISDYQLPQFDAPSALQVLQESQLDIPFLVVSGTIGEISAVTMMKAGAHDYLMKNNLTRLPEAVRREVRECLVRHDRRQAERRLQQTAAREQLIRLMTDRIRRSLNLDQILTTTVMEVQKVLHTDRVILVKCSESTAGKVVQESVAPGVDSLLGQTFPLVDWPHGQVGDPGGGVQSVTAVATDQLDPCQVDFWHQYQVCAHLVVPIREPDGLWGLLIAHHCSGVRQWSDDEIQLLQQLADQVAIAIQQANLYQQAQLELAERQRAERALQQLNQDLERRVQERTQSLQQQAEQERLLRLIVQNIHRSLDFNEILTTVLSEMRQTLQVDRVAVYRFEPDWSGQFIAESVGEGWVSLVGEDSRCIWKDTYLQEHQGGRYRQNQSFAVHDIYAVGHSPCHIDLLVQFQAKAYAIAPIFLDDQLWGLLAAYQNSAPRNWQDWEVSLLQQIALQMAIALRQSRLYQAAQTQVKALEQVSQMKDDFLSTVSHELRSPLVNIKMAIQLIRLNLSQNAIHDDRLDRYIDILEEGCVQELSLINDLLDLQRLEAGVQPLELESIYLRDWLGTIAEPFATRAHTQQQQLTIDIAPDLPPLTTDLSALKRILGELLHNACKYTPPNESITLTATVIAANLHLSVINTGVELPPDELSRIFDKFYRVTCVDRWKHGGTGLGLALVKRLAERLQGTVEVESSQQRVCFTVQLPLLNQSAPVPIGSV